MENTIKEASKYTHPESWKWWKTEKRNHRIAIVSETFLLVLALFAIIQVINYMTKPITAIAPDEIIRDENGEAHAIFYD